jgi:hypothetical protein
MENLNQIKKVAEVCPCCGASTKLHWHRLNKGLVNVLVKVKKEVMFKKRNKICISELGLNTTEFCNFQKLRYHALVAKCRNAEGKRIGGHWLLTKRGNQFCKGLIQIPEKVGTFRNIIRKKSMEVVGINDVLKGNDLPYWDSIDEYGFEFFDISDIGENLWDENNQSKLDI